MSKYIPLMEFLRKHSNSPVEFKMYIGSRIQADPDFKLHEIGGKSKEVAAKNVMDDIVIGCFDKIKNGDKNVGVICDIIDSKFVYQTKVNKIADAELEIIKLLRDMQYELPEMVVGLRLDWGIDDILIINAWNEHKINDRFCIKKA